jgi:putative transposase
MSLFSARGVLALLLSRRSSPRAENKPTFSLVCSYKQGRTVRYSLRMRTRFVVAAFCPSTILAVGWQTVIPKFISKPSSRLKLGNYLIQKQYKEELHKYITGIITERDQKLLAIHCMPDHTHLLVGLRPSHCLSDLVRDVKNASTNFINRRRWVLGRFSWQEGFGAFSYGHSQLTGIINYIRDQEQHHAKKTFRQEYVQFLKKYQIAHDERFIFKSLDSGPSLQP